MTRKILFVLMTFFAMSQAISATIPIEYLDIQNICNALQADDVETSEGGFPLVVDKTTVQVESRACGMKVLVNFYDFNVESMARDKFEDLVVANQVAGINWQPVDGNPDEYEWQFDGRKYAWIGIQGNLIFNIVFNVKQEHFASLVELARQKYISL